MNHDPDQRVYLLVQQFAPKSGVEWNTRIHMWVIRNHAGHPEFIGRGHTPPEAWRDALTNLKGTHGEPGI